MSNQFFRGEVVSRSDYFPFICLSSLKHRDQYDFFFITSHYSYKLCLASSFISISNTAHTYPKAKIYSIWE